MNAAAFAISRNGNPWIAKISNEALIDEDFGLFFVLDVDSILFASGVRNLVRSLDMSLTETAYVVRRRSE